MRNSCATTNVWRFDWSAPSGYCYPKKSRCLLGLTDGERRAALMQAVAELAPDCGVIPPPVPH